MESRCQCNPHQRRPASPLNLHCRSLPFSEAWTTTTSPRVNLQYPTSPHFFPPLLNLKKASSHSHSLNKLFRARVRVCDPFRSRGYQDSTASCTRCKSKPAKPASRQHFKMDALNALFQEYWALFLALAPQAQLALVGGGAIFSQVAVRLPLAPPCL